MNFSARFFIALQHLLPQRWLTVLLARVMNWRRPIWLKLTLIHWFIRRYRIDLSCVANAHLDLYLTFNQFFIRALKPGARPLGEAAIVSPADGTVSQISAIKEGTLIQAKGLSYTLEDLLTSHSDLTPLFHSGLFATIYLAPKDYHRVHMPMAGRLLKTIYVPGTLFSVNTITAQNVVNLFARNERLICEFENDQGKFIVIFVGALFVAGISTSWAGDVQRGRKIVVTDYTEKNIVLARGQEAGHFKFGSTVILLLPGTFCWKTNWQAGSSILMGQSLADLGFVA